MNKPQIRFKGFDQEWQHYILKDACTSFKYGLNAAATPFDGKHKYLRITDIDDTSRQFCKDDLSSPLIDTFSDEFKMKPKDIVFARTGASVGKTYLYNQIDGEVYWAGFLIRASVSDSFDPNFVFQTTLTNDYWKYINISSQRSGQPGVNAEQYAEFPFVAPIKSEQEQIGNYFKQIDEMIAEAEREIGRLEKMKQASLQKMFPRPGQTTPEIRFTGFSEPWALKPLAKLTERITRKNGSESDLALTISSMLGLVDQETYFNHRVASKDLSNYYLIQNGEFAYNKSTSEGFPWGSVKRLDRYDKGVLSTLYIVFRIISSELHSDFLCVYFDTNLWYEHLSLNAAEGARNHGLLNISADDFFSLEILLPDIAEQKAIGEYFRNLDSLLSAKRQKLVKLRNIKQACLDKMFVNTEEL